MAIPGTTAVILDGGLGVSSPAVSTPCIIGIAETGPANTPTLIGNQRQLRDIFGNQGPLTDCAGLVLGFAGGPVVCVRTTGGIAATYGATAAAAAATAALVSSTGAGADNEINLLVATSAPKNTYSLVITIVTGGARAATTFTYSLDGGQTTSPVVAAAAIVALGTSGVSLEFEGGTTAPYVAGATYTGFAFPGAVSSANITSAFNALDASSLRWSFYVVAGDARSSTEVNIMLGTLATRVASNFTTQSRAYRAIASAGGSTFETGATTIAQILTTSDRLLVAAGAVRSPAPFPVTGRSLPLTPAAHIIAAYAAANLISTDLAQVSGASTIGAILGALPSTITHNEYAAPGGLDAANFSTLRTFPNLTGAYVTNARLRAAAGSDFQFWQHGRVMDEAFRVADQELTLMLSSILAAKTDGTGQLTELSARSIESRVQRQLDNVIGSNARAVGPRAIDGTTGHTSDIVFQVSRLNNVISTSTIEYTIAIVPRGYAKTITGTYAYRLTAGGI
jgi:hypothetical protein